MMNVSLFLRIWLLCLTALLTACGGGGDNSSGFVSVGVGGTSTGGTGSTTTVQGTLSLKLQDATGVQVSSVSLSQPGIILATLLDIRKKPVSNTVITFSIDNDTVGVLDPVTATALTDSNGQARIYLNVGENAGAATVSASAIVAEQTIIGAVSFAGAGGAAKTGKLSLVMENATGTSISSASPGQLVASLVDSSGSPVANSEIVFSVNYSEVGVLDPSTGTALTDSSGKARITLRAGSAGGAATVTATTLLGEETLVGSLSFSSDGSGGAVAAGKLTIELKNSNGVSTTSIAPTTPGTLQVTLQDSSQKPVANAQINFSVNNANIAFFDPASGTALTDSNGRATISLKSGSLKGAATATASATVNGETISGSVSFSSAGGSTSAGKLTLSLQNSAGASISNITESQSGVLVAKFVDASTQPLVGAVVSFSIDNGAVGVFDPVAATALTNTSGEARINLKAGTTAGAATVTASGINEGAKLSDTISFSSTFANVALGSGSGSSFQKSVLAVGALTNGVLSAGGTTTITANVVDLDTNNSLYALPVEVTFSSSCAADFFDHDSDPATAEVAKAVIDTTVIAVNGTASATYRANGCVGKDTITATIAGGAGASVVIEIAAADAGSLEFVSATPQLISIKGTGNASRPEASVLLFRIKNKSGFPVAGRTVNFSLSTEFGGLSLSALEATSDTAGLVQVVVNSGAVAGSVRVRASHTPEGLAELYTFSDELVISTGLPDSNSMDIALEFRNPEGWNYSGEEVKATVYAADYFNNPVPDGTALYFTTEGGAIEPSCLTTNGACVLTWRSQDPRPSSALANHTGDVTVLVRAVGEETFTDTNGNGYFDSGESFTDLGEAFRDDDEDGVFDPGVETYFDYNNNGSWDGPNGLYNGSLCLDAARALGHCAALVEVTDSIKLVMSSSGITITPSVTSVTVAVKSSASFSVQLKDVNDNAPPYETAVTVSTSAGSIVAGGSFKVYSTTEPLSFGVVVSGGDEPKSGIITITTTTPNGVISSQSLGITVN